MNYRQLLTAYKDLIVHQARVGWQLLHGIWKISKLQLPLVSIFGSSKLSADNEYSEFARTLAQMLVDADISVITGGGPGIMEAANCGAKKEGDGIRSIGIGVKGLEGGKLNPCVQDFMIMHYYFPRKWLLTRYSIAFVVFPGGVGTLEELAEIMTLIQTKKRDTAPIILVGTTFWKSILAWMGQARDLGLMFEDDIKNLMITDDVKEACDVIVRYVKEKKYKSPT